MYQYIVKQKHAQTLKIVSETVFLDLKQALSFVETNSKKKRVNKYFIFRKRM